MLDLRAQLARRARQERKAIRDLKALLARRAQQDPREILALLGQLDPLDRLPSRPQSQPAL
jgi:hypothetical protein